MFLQESIFRTMKRVLICMSVVFTVFSCTDEVHHMQEKYAVFDTETTVTSNKLKVRFSADLTNYGDEEIIDHGFFWGPQIIYYNYKYFDATINSFINEELREFLLENEMGISLGKLENPKNFSYEHNGIALAQKYFVVPYIKTGKYFIYGKMHLFENKASAAFSKKSLSFQIPYGKCFSVNNDIYIFYNFYNNTEIWKLDNSYLLVHKQRCPEYLSTLHFIIGENIYFSTENQLMWKYSTTTDTWERISDVPSIYPYRLSSPSFSIDQKGYSYAFDYQGNSFIFEFDPATNIWTKKNKTDLSPNIRPFVFQRKNQTYVLNNSELWYYDENLATLIYKTNIDNDIVYSIVTMNDIVYMISRKNNTFDIFDIFTYNPDNNETEKFCSLNSLGYHTAISLSSDNKMIFLAPEQDYLYELDFSKLR